MLFLALAWSALFVSPQTGPTLGSLEGLPPEAVGDLVLSGRDHSVIEAVEFPTFAGPGMPGLVDVDLVEQASRQAGGCVRSRWRAAFRRSALESPQGDATFHSAYPTTEVALPADAGCAEGEFVHVNPGLTVEEALRALGRLVDVRSGNAEVRFSCTDRTQSGLCQSPLTTREELTRLVARVVTRQDGATELWLGDRGQAVTVVAFPDNDPFSVRVERRIPAPF